VNSLSTVILSRAEVMEEEGGISNDFHKRTVWLSVTLAAQIHEPRPLVGSLYSSTLDVLSTSAGLAIATKVLAAKTNGTKTAKERNSAMPNRKSDRHNLMDKI